MARSDASRRLTQASFYRSEKAVDRMDVRDFEKDFLSRARSAAFGGQQTLDKKSFSKLSLAMRSTACCDQTCED
jgi:hypothetical protein